MRRRALNRRAIPLVGAVVAALVAALWMLLGPVPAASAHGGPGKLELVSHTAVDATHVTYVVILTHAGDGDPGEDATVTVVASSPGAAAIAPVTMRATKVPGQYTATVAFPSAGAWSVRFTAVTPPATLEQAETVGDTAPSTTASGAAPESTEAPSTTVDASSTVAPTTVAETTTVASADATSADADEGSSALPWILGGLGIVVVAVAIAVASRRGRPGE